MLFPYHPLTGYNNNRISTSITSIKHSRICNKKFPGELPWDKHRYLSYFLAISIHEIFSVVSTSTSIKFLQVFSQDMQFKVLFFLFSCHIICLQCSYILDKILNCEERRGKLWIALVTLFMGILQ